MEKQIKPCINCGSIRRYPPRSSYKTGACVDCANKRSKRWEEKNKERVKEVQLLYKERNIETWKKSKCKSASKERNKNPDKTKARLEVKKAIQKEMLLPISKCFCIDCGTIACDYHHENYLFPLEVVPLCRSCHIKRHKTCKPNKVKQKTCSI